MSKPPFYKSMWNSIKGLVWMLKSERNFQLEVVALLINLFLIVYFQLSTVDAAIILIVCSAVLALEIVNTCIEKLCDIIHPEYDYRIKIIKDAAAGAVLLTAICSVFVGILVYRNYFF